MVFCPQCGSENPDTARFCDQCGAELVQVHQARQVQTVQGNADSPGNVPSDAPPAPPSPGTPPISAGPNTCPQCGATVIPGEAFCDHCGAAILPIPSREAGNPSPSPGSEVPPQVHYPPPQPVGSVPAAPPVQPPPPPPHPAPPAAPRHSLRSAQLVVKESGMALPLPDAAQALVGRADPVSNFYPDIDLSPYGALQAGVGRRHVRLQVQGAEIFVEDLDSTNGTFLNGQRLLPHTPRPLKHGDELRLGTMALVVQL